jgi:hypothetical protein
MHLRFCAAISVSTSNGGFSAGVIWVAALPNGAAANCSEVRELAWNSNMAGYDIMSVDTLNVAPALVRFTGLQP